MQQPIAADAVPPLVGSAIVAVLCSKWYGRIVDSLREKCVAVLADKGVHDIRVHTLPGVFEFPYAAGELARVVPGLDAIICLGVVLKGDTYHFEMIVDECVRGLGAVSRTMRVPIINEVLPVASLAHAEARAGDDACNKGIEAAVAAVEIIRWRRGLAHGVP